MSGLAVRPVSACDVEDIGAIARARPFAAKWTKKAFADELARPESIFLVAKDGGGVRGYALVRVVEDDGCLLDIAAAEDGKGCGRALWAALVQEARRRGCRRIILEASARNARALAFYERAGAKVVGRRKKFYNDGSDALLMDRNLA